MRLQAIELDQVGTFSAPVRISNIGPGLNVLAGANELGKSTLLRALTALFTEQHRTTRQSVRDLRPYAGGAPLMACTFELQGHAWRLEKRYLSAHKALLQRLDGSEQHLGADAENRLAELLRHESGLATSLPLLWVGQGAGTELPAMTDGVRHSLGQLLAAEADSTSGVGRAQAVLRAVEAELGQLVTVKTGKARKNSGYYKLLAERSEVSATLDAARHKAGEAQQRLERLAELQRTAAELSDRDALTSRQAQLGEHETRLNKAREARRQLLQLAERVAFLESQNKQRVMTLAAYDEGLRERAEIADVMSAANEELAAIAAAGEEIAGQMQAATQAVTAGAERARVLRGQLDNFRRAGAQAQRRERLQQLGTQRQRLAAIADNIDRITTEAADFNWPDKAVSDLRRAVLRLEQLRARKEASAPRIRFAYEAGRSAGFRIDGADMRDGADVMTAGPVTIEVEGIGRIDVIPATSETLAVLSLDLEAAEAQLVDGLAAMGATDLADAEVREQRRVDLRNAHQRLVSERDGLAPEGGDRLAAETAQLLADETADTIVRGDGDPLPASVAEIELDLATALDAQARASATHETLTADKSALDQRRAAIAAERRIRRTRRDELDLKYAKADGAADPRDELVAQVAAADQERSAAVRDRLAVQEVALSQMAVTELEQAIAAQRTDIDQRAERLAAVRQEMRHVEGMLARDFEDGAGDQVRELDGRLAELDVRVRDTERHIAALRLLVAELGAETSQRRDAIARPLSRRLTQMAARIWPGAEIPLTSDLTVDGLARGGQKETTDHVSWGTREQIAVLARLAYAGLLAQGAETVPVILDDPLVFSDDQRLDALFDTIAEAAQDQQIIVLTCHQRAFEPLITRYGATRLVLAEATVAA